jgi:hypothetical protein
MKNLEAGARFANPEEHAVVLFAAVKGCAVKEAIIRLHKAICGIVSVQKSSRALGKGKQLGELSGGGQFEKGAALGIGDALIGNLRRAIKISVRGLNDEIGPRSLWTRVTTGATVTGESK